MTVTTVTTVTNRVFDPKKAVFGVTVVCVYRHRQAPYVHLRSHHHRLNPRYWCRQAGSVTVVTVVTVVTMIYTSVLFGSHVPDVSVDR